MPGRLMRESLNSRIIREDTIPRHDCAHIQQCLGDDDPVEGIVVNSRQLPNVFRFGRVDREDREACDASLFGEIVAANGRFAVTNTQRALRYFDREFPKRSDTHGNVNAGVL